MFVERVTVITLALLTIFNYCVCKSFFILLDELRTYFAGKSISVTQWL